MILGHLSKDLMAHIQTWQEYIGFFHEYLMHIFPMCPSYHAQIMVRGCAQRVALQVYCLGMGGFQLTNEYLPAFGHGGKSISTNGPLLPIGRFGNMFDVHKTLSKITLQR